jgi:hypothetical protein
MRCPNLTTILYQLENNAFCTYVRTLSDREQQEYAKLYLHGLMCGAVIKTETVIAQSIYFDSKNIYVFRRYSRRMRWAGHVVRMV